MMKDKRRWNKNHMLPSSEELELVKMLLNPNVTEFDGYAFNKKCSVFNHMDYYRHIVKNCPRMKKGVHVLCQCWGREDLEDLTINCLQTWTNLRHFYVRGIFCDDKIMRLIQENCPQLELVIFLYCSSSFQFLNCRGMEFTLSSGFTEAGGLESLTKMEQLKYMHIKVHDKQDYEDKEQFTSYVMLLVLLNLIAGRVPNLMIADFDFKKEMSWLFIKLHGQTFPNKNLTIRQVE
jgi:hypothetical protein